MRRFVAAVILAVLALPAAGVHGQQPPLFEFGRKGGTRSAFTATIGTDGVVSVTGGVRRLGPVTLTQPALAGLRKLADAEGFYSLPRNIKCPGPAGFATQFIHIRTAKHDKYVQEYGGCRPGFAQLYDVLVAAAALR